MIVNWLHVCGLLATAAIVIVLLRRRLHGLAVGRASRVRRNMILTAGVGLLGALVVVIASLAYGRAYALVHPPRAPVQRTFADVGVDAYESVSFAADDGLQLRGWYVPPENGATVVFVHGFGANRSELLDAAALLIAHGYGALVFDLRNSGESEGELTTLGYLETNDVRAAVDYVIARPEADPDRVGLLGHSMGGATVLRAAPELPQVRAVVAESAYASLEDEVGAGLRAFTGLPAFPFAPLVIWFGEREAQIEIGAVRPVDDIARISPRPVLLIHGELDEIVPAAHGQQLYAAAREPKALYLVPGAGHGGFLHAQPEEYARRVVGFFDRNLLTTRQLVPPQ